MKKVIFSLIIGVATITMSQQKTFALKIIQETTSNKVVGWFSARTFGCWGWNFCDGSAPWDKNGRTKEYLNDDNTITFYIPISSLNKKNQEFYADKDVFKIEKAQNLDAKECNALGLPEGTRFVVGTYPLKKIGGNLVFTVKIK